jgi:Na+-driven multidrug efflux pump
MRARERAFFLILGVVSAYGFLAGAWLLPLLAFVALEGLYSGAEVFGGTRHGARRPARAGRLARAA